jgi:CAAX prenyl protease-like protein
MEELFWRSFLLRYLINPDFKKVPIGTFSLFSFVSTVVLFGLEHHRWLPGIIAGIIYTLLLYRKKELFDCILSHAITNLVLGIYVIMTHQWRYW